MHVPGIYQPSNRLIFSIGNYYNKKDIRIFCFSKRLCWQMINTKVVGYDSRRGQPYSLIKKEALAQVFSCEFCEIFKNTFFTEHLWTTVSMTFKYEILIVRCSQQRCFIKKGVLKIFTKFTGKHLCQSPFFNKVSGVSL